MTLATVHIPVDADLSRLLRESMAGQPHYMASTIVGGMANACFPGHRQPSGTWNGRGTGNVRLESSMLPVIADHLAALLAKARADADPGADAVAGLLKREFGRTEETEVSGG
jgi:hypothetical protein